MKMSLFRKKPKTISVCISTFDADLEFVVKANAKSRAIFDLVCQTIGLRESWYFGLAYRSPHGEAWVKPTKQLIKQQIRKTEDNQYMLTFLAKFYPESVEDELIQEVTRHLFFLQTQEAILIEDLYCPPENAILLASYALQAKYGDYDLRYESNEVFASSDFLPKRVKEQFQMTEDMWDEKINDWYSQHRGLSRDEAELEYLKIARDLEMFGIKYFKITNVKGSNLWLGISPTSVNVYEPENQLIPIVSFQWSELSDMSYNENKFTMKQSTSYHGNNGTLQRGTVQADPSRADTQFAQSKDFIFNTEEPGINKLILELCRGNHDLFMKRRRVDSIEIQQMKMQAKEERARKQADKSRVAREKDLRRQIEMEKEELKQKVKELQEETRIAMEALHRSEETADLLAEKANIAEEEALLLKRKANHAEAEMQRIKTEFAKTQEANVQLQQNLQNYDQVTKQLAEESKLKAAEADKLRYELKHAMHAQAEAKEKLNNVVMVNSSNDLPPYSQYVSQPLASTPITVPTSMDQEIVGDIDLPTTGVDVTGASTSPLQIQPLPHTSELSVASDDSNHDNGYARPSDMQHLSQEIEKERMEYQAKSRHIEEQLAMLKTEIDGLKVDEKLTVLDHAYTENSLKAVTKYQSINKNKETSPEQRLQLYENL